MISLHVLQNNCQSETFSFAKVFSIEFQKLMEKYYLGRFLEYNKAWIKQTKLVAQAMNVYLYMIHQEYEKMQSNFDLKFVFIIRKTSPLNLKTHNLHLQIPLEPTFNLSSQKTHTLCLVSYFSWYKQTLISAHSKNMRTCVNFINFCKNLLAG